jgi:hypothetical protein
MSEVLQIERERLLQKSQQEMHRQLSPNLSATQAAPGESATQVPPVEATSRGFPEGPPANPPVVPERRPNLDPNPSPQPATFVTDATGTLPDAVATQRPTAGSYLNVPTASARPQLPQGRMPTEDREPFRIEGLSRYSRVVGDDLSEFGPIVRHSATSVKAKTWPYPAPVERYYTDLVDPALPFTAQRNVLICVRTLTLSWGVLTCQIPLDLLATTANIRNLKTLRKWLADLQARNHIRYTPVHGDLRGSLITITPPREIVACMEEWWKQNPDATPRLSNTAGTERDSQVEGSLIRH